MRFLLRLLLLLVLSSYLLRHYGFFLGENLRHMHSAEYGELLNRLPGITKRSSPRRIGTSDPAAWSVAAPRPDARSNGSARYSRQYQKYHLSARLHGDRQTALRVYQCDEVPAHAGSRG
jgi:hypothetical protein